MIYKHKRTGDLYRLLLISYSVERQKPSVIYCSLANGAIFDRDGDKFYENFEFMHFSQAQIIPKEPAKEAIPKEAIPIGSEHVPRGSQVTCDKCGKVVCEVVADDVKCGELQNNASFGKWRIKEPKPGATLDGLICECGGRWVQAHFGGYILHLKDFGWWPAGAGG